MRLVLILLVAWFLPLSGASADYRVAQAEFMAWSMDERRLVQWDLTWTGDYIAFVDAEFGPRTYQAIQGYQQRSGWRATGTLSPTQREALRSDAVAIVKSIGFEMLDDPHAQLTLGVPKRLAPDSVRTQRGTRWRSPSEDFVLDTILVAASEASFEELYRRLARESRTRRVEYARLLDDRFVVTGRDAGMSFYTVMHRMPGGTRGIAVSWSPGVYPGINGIVLGVAGSVFDIDAGAAASSQVNTPQGSEDFWVMVGSYENRSTAIAAARQYAELVHRISLPLNVSVFLTGTSLHAVAIGPAPRAVAETLRHALRGNQRPSDAWLSSGHGFVSEVWSAEAGREPQQAQPPTVPEPRADTMPKSGSGTGFFITADGVMLTNAHVVADCELITVPDHGPARILRRDARNDLAVIQVEIAEATPHATFQTNRTRLQSDVVVLGYPLASFLGQTLNTTAGQVSSLSGIQGDTRFIQITAPVQPGNSGGPVLDMTGRVVGVATGRISDHSVFGSTGVLPQNINFAIRKEAVVAFLSAANVAYQIDGSDEEQSRSDIAEQAAAFTRPVICSG